MQSRLSRGPTARIISGIHCVCFAPGGGKLSLRREFSQRPRSTCHAAAEAEQWLCSQMDQMEGIKTGDRLSSSFTIRSSTRFLRSEARPAVLPPQRKGSTLRLSFSEEGDREDVDEFSQNVRLHKHVVNK